MLHDHGAKGGDRSVLKYDDATPHDTTRQALRAGVQTGNVTTMLMFVARSLPFLEAAIPRWRATIVVFHTPAVLIGSISRSVFVLPVT